MNVSSWHRRVPGGFALAALAFAAACTTTQQPPAKPGAKPPVAAAPASTAPAAATAGALLFAVPQQGGSTAQGGSLEAFAYSEKAGDAKFDALAVTDGVARITGSIWPQKGSTWAGIGFLATPGASGKTSDLSAQRSLRIQLASPTATQLRVRVMGADPATRDAGCYPMTMAAVSGELREIVIPLSAFAPEGYCEARGKSIASVLPAVAAIEVSDPTLAGTTRRVVDFRVGRISLTP
jgi:hypothetical protein